MKRSDIWDMDDLSEAINSRKPGRHGDTRECIELKLTDFVNYGELFNETMKMKGTKLGRGKLPKFGGSGCTIFRFTSSGVGVVTVYSGLHSVTEAQSHIQLQYFPSTVPQPLNEKHAFLSLLYPLYVKHLEIPSDIKRDVWLYARHMGMLPKKYWDSSLYPNQPPSTIPQLMLDEDFLEEPVG